MNWVLIKIDIFVGFFADMESSQSNLLDQMRKFYDPRIHIMKSIILVEQVKTKEFLSQHLHLKIIQQPASLQKIELLPKCWLRMQTVFVLARA